MQAMDSGPGLTVKEAATLIGCHPQTVRKYIKAGKLAASKAEGTHGPEWRISAESAESLAVSADREGAKTAPAIAEVLSRLAALEQVLKVVAANQQAMMEQLPALPPAPEEKKSWWQRLRSPWRT